MKIRKYTGIRLISFLSALILVLIGFILQQRNQSRSLNRALTYGYERNFEELVDSMALLSQSMQKLVYASGQTCSVKLGTEIYGAAQAAEAALTTLPLGDISLEKTGAFLNKVGQYALALSCQAVSDKTDTAETVSNLRALSRSAVSLSEQLSDLRFQAQKQESKLLYGTENALYTDFFTGLEENFEALPTLVYDGLYTDSDEKQPQKRADTTPVEKETAIETLSELTGYSFSSDAITERENDGSLYYILSEQTDDGEIWAEFDASDGSLLYYTAMILRSETPPDEQAAISDAREFLQKLGLENPEPSSIESEDGALTVTFYHREGDTLCYADRCLITVGEDGTILKADLKDYYANHQERTLSPAAITEEELLDGFPQEMTVSSSQSVLLHTAGNQEKPCYEFTCTDRDGNSYLIYYNSETGEMEDIQIQ